MTDERTPRDCILEKWDVEEESLLPVATPQDINYLAREAVQIARLPSRPVVDISLLSDGVFRISVRPRHSAS